jgi:hypothetical protein
MNGDGSVPVIGIIALSTAATLFVGDTTFALFTTVLAGIAAWTGFKCTRTDR